MKITWYGHSAFRIDHGDNERGFIRFAWTK